MRGNLFRLIGIEVLAFAMCFMLVWGGTSGVTAAAVYGLMLDLVYMARMIDPMEKPA